MAEKTYPVYYQGKVVGQLKLTDIEFEPMDELLIMLDDNGLLEGFEVYK